MPIRTREKYAFTIITRQNEMIQRLTIAVSEVLER